MLLYTYFHVILQPVPDFAPSLNRPGYGKFGYRPWYELYVFWGDKPTKQMSYDSKNGDLWVVVCWVLTYWVDHYDRVKQMHIKNDICMTKATHTTWHFAAQTARAYGASVSSTKALGHWLETDAMANCYDRAILVDALLAASMFNGLKPEEHFLAHDVLGECFCLLVLMQWSEQCIALAEPPCDIWPSGQGQLSCNLKHNLLTHAGRCLTHDRISSSYIRP